jgi:hypothetical protein
MVVSTKMVVFWVTSVSEVLAASNIIAIALMMEAADYMALQPRRQPSSLLVK